MARLTLVLPASHSAVPPRIYVARRDAGNAADGVRPVQELRQAMASSPGQAHRAQKETPSGGTVSHLGEVRRRSRRGLLRLTVMTESSPFLFRGRYITNLSTRG